MIKKILAILLGLLVGFFLLGAGVLSIAVIVSYPKLPELTVLTKYQPKIPLRIYTSDNKLIGEFGEEHRSFVKIEQVPLLMKQAVIAAEDERFYQHGGVDYVGVLRAILSNITSGKLRSGASTITMQVAKNFFLSSQKTASRKFNEALLAIKIERALSKDKILELYFNQIYLGQRAYGFASASQTYFGKDLDHLTIAEMAMLGGLPKAPSGYNPVVNPTRARRRQLYVLGRMLFLKFITKEQYEEAKAETLHLAKPSKDLALPAQYVAEMVRQIMQERYKDTTYTEGFRVYTTIDSRHQQWAFNAIRSGLQNFDHKSSYRGVDSYIDLSAMPSNKEERETAMDEALPSTQNTKDIQQGIVTEVSKEEVAVYLHGGMQITIRGSGLLFAKRALSSSFKKSRQIRPGAVVYVKLNPKGYWEITQIPEVEGALISLDPNTGAIKSLVGGFDFNHSSFNHVTQAWRQPGSTFKPFIYSAGIERGLTESTLMNDAPLTIDLGGGKIWQPRNSDGKFAGMIPLSHGLMWSKNLVSVRVLMAVGLDYARQYIQRFGFSPDKHPASFTIVLGSGSVTPIQIAEGYSVFANGGYRVHAYFIDHIEDGKGNVIAQTEPAIAGKNAPQAIDPRNAFIVADMMRGVIKHGTGMRALVLKRDDLSGKTGTTSDSFDAWFSGYNSKLVAIAWLGYDKPKSLGRHGFGGTITLPIWIDYMSHALKGMPESIMKQPSGIVAKDGNYYYQEYQTTNPLLKLDSDASSLDGTNASDTVNASDTAANAITPPVDVTPIDKNTSNEIKNQLF